MGRGKIKGDTMQVELLPVTAFHQNCSLIWDDEKNAAIIDPGGDAQKIIKRVEELGLNVKAILLTHGHLDHVGAAEELKKYFGVEILGPQKEDKFWLDGLHQQALQFGLKEVDAFEPDRWLEDGEVLKIGDIELEVLHLPGHTPGHVGFINKAHNVAFTGDVLFQQSIGRTDFPRGNHSDLIASIKNKLFPLGDKMIIVAGHGQPTTVGEERQYNPYLKN